MSQDRHSWALGTRTAGSSAVTQRGWLPSGPVVIGLTAGASTPNNVVGQTIERVIQLTSSTVSRPAAVDDVGAR